MEFYNVLILIKVICDSVRYTNSEIIYLFLTGLINTKSGHVTKIFNSKYHFTTFYKFLEVSKWSYLKVHERFFQTLIQLFRPEIKGLIIDDFINYRSRKKTTVKGKLQYDHSHKVNRSPYVWGQNILIVAAETSIMGLDLTLPVMLKLVGKGQNKIDVAVDLLKLTQRFFELNNIETGDKIATFDAFFAKKKLILSKCGFTKIFQTRHDTALFELPGPCRDKHKKGPKRKYGKKISVKLKRKLKGTFKINIYGKEHVIHYKDYVCKARFLGGQVVRALYLTFDDFDRIHLVVSTDIRLTALEILSKYSMRFKVEHIINQLKNSFFLKEIWMQNPKTYCRMMYFKLWSFVITQLSAVSMRPVIVNYVKEQMPWRIKPNGIIPLTAGIAQNLLKALFGLMSYQSFLSKVLVITSGPLNNKFLRHSINFRC